MDLSRQPRRAKTSACVLGPQIRRGLKPRRTTHSNSVKIEEYATCFLPRSKNSPSAPETGESAQAVYFSLFVGGFSLVLAKLLACRVAPSATMKASLFDSLGDVAGYLIMMLTEHLVREADEEHFPAGQGRFEPLGILSFAIYNVTTFFNLILGALERMVEGSLAEEVYPSSFRNVVLVLCVCIFAKLLCVGFCSRVARRSGSEVAQTLCADHVLDALSNCFVLVVLCVLHFGHGRLGRLEYYLDDLCCIFLSSYVLVNWARVVRTELKMLAGHAADPDLSKKMVHSASILVQNFPGIQAKVGLLRLFHAGKNLMAEVELQVSCGDIQSLAELVQLLEYTLTDDSCGSIERVMVTLRAESSEGLSEGIP